MYYTRAVTLLEPFEEFVRGTLHLLLGVVLLKAKMSFSGTFTFPIRSRSYPIDTREGDNNHVVKHHQGNAEN